MKRLDRLLVKLGELDDRQYGYVFEDLENSIQLLKSFQDLQWGFIEDCINETYILDNLGITIESIKNVYDLECKEELTQLYDELDTTSKHKTYLMDNDVDCSDLVSSFEEIIKQMDCKNDDVDYKKKIDKLINKIND